MQSDPSQLVRTGVRFHESMKRQRAYVPQQRTQYLARNLARTKANMLAAEAVAAGAPASSDRAVAQMSQERIIGSSDLVDINYLELAIAVGRGVSRIQIANEYGTGFLVGPSLAMTNHHVIPDEENARRAIFQFDYQDNATGELLPRQDFRADPLIFFLTSEELDFTIVGLAPASDKGCHLTSYPWLKLIGETGKAEKGDPLNIIQHPRGGLKQIAFRENHIIEIPDGKREFLYYTTDTEPGSSGSPCFNDQWELVALHHSGVPALNKQKQILRKDRQVWREGVDPEGLINWVGNEGARVSAIVAALRAAALKPEWRDLRDRALESAAPNPIELARSGVAADRPVEGGGTTQSSTWTIPIQVTITVGGAAGVPTSVVAATPQARVSAAPAGGGLEVAIDQDWSSREGYDPSFLGQSIPLPGLSPAQRADTVEVLPQYRANGDKYLLNYHHYSLVMNKKRRTAWFSAGMIDGERYQDFKRGKDKWFIDPRIDSGFQMGEELYAGAHTDRGHLTRFKDLSWGATMDEAVNATNDTFHFTNCTLQLDGFNEGKERWQGLEQFLLEQHAKKNKRKLVVMTGPVLLDSDPLYRNPSMNYSARIPLGFWKVCCLVRQDGSLAATGFKLGQEDIAALPGFGEKFDIGIAQVAISELEQLTGLDFGVLTKYDHFAAGGGPGTLEIARPGGGKRKIKPIASFEDIVV
jgi:endonuclease G, mitochondrial